MKQLTTIIALLILCSCKENTTTESGMVRKTDTTAAAAPVSDSAALMSTSKTILQLIKQGNWTEVVSYVHPVKGIRFSPFSSIDTASGKHFTRDQLQQTIDKNPKISWGNTFAEDEMFTTLKGYADTFVYDVDFSNAQQTLYNRSVSGPTTVMNNINEFFPGAVYTEFYFPGFDKKYEGMDWKALYLLFEKHEGKYYLTGVVHDEWTP